MREAADGRADICCHAVGPAGFDQVVQKDAKRSLTTTGHASTCATLSRTSGGIPRARASCSYRLGGGERDYHGDTARVAARGGRCPSRVSRIGKFDGRAFALHRAAAAFLRGCDARGSRSHATPRRRRRRPGQARPARARRRRRRRDALARASRAAPPRHPHGPPRPPPTAPSTSSPRSRTPATSPSFASTTRSPGSSPCANSASARPVSPEISDASSSTPRATIGADPPRPRALTVFHPVPEGAPGDFESAGTPVEYSKHVAMDAAFAPRAPDASALVVLVTNDAEAKIGSEKTPRDAPRAFDAAIENLEGSAIENVEANDVEKDTRVDDDAESRIRRREGSRRDRFPSRVDAYFGDVRRTSPRRRSTSRVSVSLVEHAETLGPRARLVEPPSGDDARARDDACFFLIAGERVYLLVSARANGDAPVVRARFPTQTSRCPRVGPGSRSRRPTRREPGVRLRPRCGACSSPAARG